MVSDVQQARESLAAQGVEISEVFHPEAPGSQFQPMADEGRADGTAGDRASYGSFATFADPDGNVFLLQEVTTRLPGRIERTRFDVASLEWAVLVPTFERDAASGGRPVR